MPELPEVETIRKQLLKYIPVQIETVSYSSVASSVLINKQFSPKRKKILNIERCGKVLDFILDNDLHIISRLGMSGSWRVSPDKIVEKHTHIQFKCRDQKENIVYLGYVDPRRFGKMYFLKSKEREEFLEKLGVDVSTDDFTVEYIKKVFSAHPRKKIKPFLLEQRFFAGIGNYMASEICALSHILPDRLLKDISGKEIRQIKKVCKQVIDQSIAYNGMTFHGGYSDTKGEKGQGLKNLVVFNQTRCNMCRKEDVIKITLAGRGTYYCPLCQT